MDPRGRAGRWHNCFSSIQWHNSVTKMFDDFFFDIFLIFGNFDFFRKIPIFFSTKLFTHLQNALRVASKVLISWQMMFLSIENVSGVPDRSSFPPVGTNRSYTHTLSVTSSILGHRANWKPAKGRENIILIKIFHKPATGNLLCGRKKIHSHCNFRILVVAYRPRDRNFHWWLWTLNFTGYRFIGTF